MSSWATNMLSTITRCNINSNMIQWMVCQWMRCNIRLKWKKIWDKCKTVDLIWKECSQKKFKNHSKLSHNQLRRPSHQLKSNSQRLQLSNSQKLLQNNHQQIWKVRSHLSEYLNYKIQTPHNEMLFEFQIYIDFNTLDYEIISFYLFQIS